MADTESIRNSIKKLEKKGIVVDSAGNVINMRTTKVRTTPLWMRKNATGGKRGRPRTKPAKTTQSRKYKRSYEHTKEAKAKRKAATAEKKLCVKPNVQQKLQQKQLLFKRKLKQGD